MEKRITAAETLSELSADPKYLGAQVGFTGVLHRLGQNLMHHPHLHCIVPGGGLTSNGMWVNSRKKFSILVKVLSWKLGANSCNLKKAKLEFYGSIVHLQEQSQFQVHFSGCPSWLRKGLFACQLESLCGGEEVFLELVATTDLQDASASRCILRNEEELNRERFRNQIGQRVYTTLTRYR